MNMEKQTRIAWTDKDGNCEESASVNSEKTYNINNNIYGYRKKIESANKKQIHFCIVFL